MSTGYEIRGLCHSRIYFQAFQKVQDGNPANPVDLGIRCHNKFTAFFLRCFNKITDFTLANGTVIYLNKGSFEKWKKAQQVEFGGLPPVLGNAVEAVSYYCCKRYESDAKHFMGDFASEKNISRGIELLNNAVQIDPAKYRTLFDDCTTIYHDLQKNADSSIVKFKANLGRIAIQMDVLKNRLQELEKSCQEFTRVKSLIASIEKLILAYGNACSNSSPAPFADVSEIFEQLNQKEWDQYNTHLKIEDLRNQNLLSNPEHTKLEQAHQKSGFEPILSGIKRLAEQHKISVMAGKINAIANQAESMFEEAYDNDRTAINEQVIYNIKLGLSQDDLQAAWGAITRAEVYAKKVSDTVLLKRIKSLEEIVEWYKKQNVDFKQQQVKAKEGLTKWTAMVSDYTYQSKAINNAKDAVKAVIKTFSDFIDGNNPDFDCSPILSQQLLLSIFKNVNPRKLNYEGLAKISGLHDSDKHVLTNAKRRFAINVLANNCTEVQESIKKYFDVVVDRENAEKYWEIYQHKAAVEKYESAAKQAPEALKQECNTHLAAAKQLGEWIDSNGFSKVNFEAQKKQVEDNLAALRKEVQQLGTSPQFEAELLPMRQLIQKLQVADPGMLLDEEDFKILGLQKPDREKIYELHDIGLKLPVVKQMVRDCQLFGWNKMLLPLSEAISKKVMTSQGLIKDFNAIIGQVDAQVKEGKLELAKFILNDQKAKVQTHPQAYAALEKCEGQLTKLIAWREGLMKTDKAAYDGMIDFCKLSKEEKDKKIAEWKNRLDTHRRGGLGGGAGEICCFLRAADSIPWGAENYLKTFYENKSSILPACQEVYEWGESRNRSNDPGVKRKTGDENHKKYELQELCTFDYSKWDLGLQSLLACSGTTSAGEMLIESWRQGFNFYQLNLLLETYLKEIFIQRDTRKLLFSLDDAFPWYSFKIEKFEKPQVQFGLDKDKLINSLKEMRKAIYIETDVYIDSVLHKGFTEKPTHKSMLYLYAIADLFGQKGDWTKPLDSISVDLNGKKGKLKIDTKLHAEFVAKLLVWDKLEERHTKVGYEAKRAAVVAFLAFWNPLSEKIALALPM